MLQSIRDKTSGWIAYLIIGLISIPFALWGINSYLGGGEQQPAAIVNGEEITQRQLDYAYARYRERLNSVFGGSLPAAFGDEIILKEQVLTQLIEERVLLEHIADQGFRVGDAKLFENIKAMAAFQENGVFNQQLYRDQLASQGYNPALFEQELRQSTEMQQLNQAINSTAFSVPVQLQRYNELQNQARQLRILTIENAAETVAVTDEAITDYYNQQSSLFMEPDRVKVDYIELSLDSVKQAVELDEEQVLQRYEQFADQLTTPEYRTASHILISVSSDASQEQEIEAKDKISALKSRIQGGEDFAKLAKEFSDDPGSAEEGGDLGEVERGMMVKPFETALFNLQVDEVSEPVKTQFGWHLIKLHEIAGGDTPSFAMAKAEIEEELRTELAESQIYDLAENLANLGYEQPDSLLPAAEQLGLTINTSDWFSRNQGSGIAEDNKIRQVAFSDDVLNQNRNSETLELEDNRIVIMHLNSHKPAERKPLELVREEIATSLKNKEGRAQAMEKGKNLLKAIQQQGKSLDNIAEETGIAVVEVGYIQRTSSALDRDVLNAAFTMAKPDGQAVFEGLSETDGDYTLIELSDVKVEVASEKSEGEESFKVLNDALANFEYQALIRSLTAKADISRTPVAELQ
ncbi:MAG: SurA N-terminal domain-containing protein [Gammaproteobacteria bacterium]|nr:SurA N-terminal domain-containing protein [Gammaproteobacteria bacterium]